MIDRPSLAWPDLSIPTLGPTCQTLRLWTQIAGKIRLALTPWLNHSWHVTLYVTTYGLTTSPIHYGDLAFSLDFDFIDSELVVRTTSGGERRVPLKPQSVAAFHGELFAALASLGIEVAIVETPSEIPDGVPFPQDTAPRTYDPAAALAFWRALVQVERVFGEYRTGFLGKASPIQLFWGSFDLAVTRFSGRRAPLHPGGIPNLPDAVTCEAYSHEEASAGFWPGGDGIPPAFYAYAYPAPTGYADAKVAPAAASYDTKLGEFILPYEAVRTAASPDDALLAFLQSTYDAAANLGAWDRKALECAPGQPRKPRPVG